MADSGAVRGGAAAQGNRILSAIPKGTFRRLEPHLAVESLMRGRNILAERVYFIDRGMVSLVQTMGDGRSVEVGAVGIDGAVGSNMAFGARHALLESMVQMPGEARTLAADALKEEIGHCRVLAHLLHATTRVQVAQIAQTAACNRLHNLEQRCCRWLLTAHDNAGGDTFSLTQEFLAMMLGVQRPGVTIAARNLQQAGAIRYVRGNMTITDRGGLERMSCECYGTIRSQSDALLGAAANA